MKGVNKWIGIGNLTNDPEVKQIENGTTVTNFSIACNESYKNKEGNKVETVDYINIVLWRGVAEVAGKYLKKGYPVYIEGKLKTRSYQDKDGNTRYVTEVVGDKMTMLGGKEQSQNTQGNTFDPSQQAIEEETDRLPF